MEKEGSRLWSKTMPETEIWYKWAGVPNHYITKRRNVQSFIDSSVGFQEPFNIL